MCIIIDANFAPQVFTAKPSTDGHPVRTWLADSSKDGFLIFGGRLGRELLKRGESRGYLAELLRAGRAGLIPDAAVEKEETRLKNVAPLQSNDPHVLSLARVSGARTLCSHDHHLQADFKNPALVSAPKGSIYQVAAHAHLLRHTSSCGKRNSARRRSR